MTIDGNFLKFLKQENSAVIREDAAGTNFTSTADGVVFEMNEWIAGIPPGIGTGQELMRYLRGAFYGPFISSVRTNSIGSKHVRFLVFVADNYRLVPRRKGAVHATRAEARAHALKKIGRQQDEIDAMTFSDAEIPPVECIRCSSHLLYKGLSYVISKIRAELELQSGVFVYVSMPSPKKDMESADRERWGRSELVSKWMMAGESDAPVAPVFGQGEGEVLARLYACWMRDYIKADCTIVIGSCDYDNIPMTLALPAKDSRGLFIRIRSARGKQAARQYIDCSAVMSTVAGLLKRPLRVVDESEHEASSWHLTVAFAMILRGTDYCDGIEGLGATAYWAGVVAAGRAGVSFVQSLDQGRRCEIDAVAMTQFMSGVQNKRARLDTRVEPVQRAIASAEWNLRYWTGIRWPQIAS